MVIEDSYSDYSCSVVIEDSYSDYSCSVVIEDSYSDYCCSVVIEDSYSDYSCSVCSKWICILIVTLPMTSLLSISVLSMQCSV